MSQAMNHDGLRTCLERLETGAEERGELFEAFADLHEFLQAHFAEEESPDGLFAQIRARAPSHADQADALQSEHLSLLRSAEFIAARSSDLPPDALAAEVAQLVALIRAHEIAEGVLYQAAMA